MNQTQQAEIEAKVLELVGNGDMFTAFDVTQSLKGFRHADVNTEVKNLFAGGTLVGYTRTSQKVGTGGASAWVYHSLSDDPTQYGQPAVTPIVPLVTAAQAMAVVNTPASTNTTTNP